MKVLVLGSMKYDDGPIFEQFRIACRNIGERFAAQGHTIILGSDNKRTADRYVAEGVSSVHGRHKVIVHFNQDGAETPAEANENGIPFYDGKATIFPGIDFSYKQDNGPWSVIHTAAIYESDVVLIIGGGRRCDLAGHIAAVLGKPVLAIPIFRGAASAISSELHSAALLEQLSDEDRESITVRWKSSSAAAVERVCTALFAHYSRTKAPDWGLIFVAWIGFASLITWVTLFIFATRDVVAYYTAFFTMSLLSVFMGTSLRISTTSLQPSSKRISMTRVFTEFAASSILAFGFILLYFVGGFIIAGKYSGLITKDDFARVGISFSLIGLAAAFLFDRAAEELRKRMEETVFRSAK